MNHRLPMTANPLAQTAEIAVLSVVILNQWVFTAVPNATTRTGGGFDWNKLWAPQT